MTLERKIIVTIDGPAGVGKSTVSKQVAKRLSLVYLDTGAMFRAVAYFASQKGLLGEQQNEIAALLPLMQMEFRDTNGERHLFLNQEDIESKIRTSEMSMLASKVSSYPEVRSQLLFWQREMGACGGILLEGRDTGSVVFPDANYKFYLTASAEVRALRRYEQMAPDQRPNLKTLQTEIEQRDKADSERAIAPLLIPKGAIVVDTSHLAEEEVVEQMLSYIRAEFKTS